MHLRGPCALLLRELGGTEFFFFFAVLHRSLQTLRSQSKYCETLHNATRDSKKQAWPQNGALGVVEEYVHSCYFEVLWGKGHGQHGQAEGIQEREKDTEYERTVHECF